MVRPRVMFAHLQPKPVCAQLIKCVLLVEPQRLTSVSPVGLAHDEALKLQATVLASKAAHDDVADGARDRPSKNQPISNICILHCAEVLCLTPASHKAISLSGLLCVKDNIEVLSSGLS